MKIFTGIVLVVLICCSYAAWSQSTTNSGTEFWTAYMDHNNGASMDGKGGDRGSLMSLYITSGVNTTGTVSIADGSFAPISFSVSANQVTIVTIPPAAFLGSTGTFNKGIHIVSKNSVAIYAHIYATAVSGATLLLPVSTLGKDYYSINYTQKSNAQQNDPAYSDFIVIATEDNTTVNITPKQQLLDGHSAGVPFTLSLNKGQLYQGLSVNDLTGTSITSVNSATGGCTKIAVFSGSSKIEIGCIQDDDPGTQYKNASSDNLFQQVYPTATWGKNYITVPLAHRNFDVFRIILGNPNTTVDPNVKLNGVNVSLYSFTNGYYEFQSQQTNYITSDQPIQVVQYAVTQGNTIDCGSVTGDVGDPEMIFLNPLEQTLEHCTLYSTGNYEIAASYINVVIKTSAVSTFTLDGVPYTKFTVVPGNSLYSYAQIPVQSGPNDVQVTTGSRGTHTLGAGDGFNAIAYGFGDVESYGYAAGTNLQNLNENILLVNTAENNATQANGCIGATYKLQLTLPYPTTSLVWDFGNGNTQRVNEPVPIGTKMNGSQKLYLYQYQNPVTFGKPGDYSVIAHVFNPNEGDCGNVDDIEFDFNISALPAADFSWGALCVNSSTAFADKTNYSGSFGQTWLWDFGDGTPTSALQNPTHNYARPGNYTVTMSVVNGNGCPSSIQKNIYISRAPVAAFLPATPDCAGQSITLTDKSTTADGKIVQWHWDYGDGTSDDFTTNQPATHIYATANMYNIQLTVTTDAGCTATSAQAIAVNPVPVVDFSLPAVCLQDASASFGDNSSIADHTESAFTYLWDFGDANATAASPNTSTLKNPGHKYSQVGNYNVTLTVTSKYGCSVSKTQAFTVNGDSPQAVFQVPNISNLCSADNIEFDDQSSVDFGNITKILWYFDYTNDPTNVVEFDQGNFPADRKYYHNYGLFNSPLPKSYIVKMVVYSGITCVSSFSKAIVINPNPNITVSPIGPLCQKDQPVQISSNLNGFVGQGVFSGPGVSADGLFDPAAAGPGSFTLNYVFTTQTTGCTYSTTLPVTVYPNPTVTLGSEVTILEGTQLRLQPQVSGDNLTFQWTPSTGLDHDNVQNPVASPSEDIVYRVIVTNGDGCQAAAEQTVHVLMLPVIPNAFTPNGDGINDTWDIKYLDTYPGNTVDVFNRYGEKVFSSIGYSTPWDGTYRGAPLPPGTYYYIINPKNGRKTISGNVTIIR